LKESSQAYIPFYGWHRESQQDQCWWCCFNRCRENYF